MPEVRITATTDVSFPTRGIVHLIEGEIVSGDFATYLLDADSDFAERCDGATPEQIEFERLQNEAVAALVAGQSDVPADVPLDVPEAPGEGLVVPLDAPGATVAPVKAPSPADVAKAKV